MLFTNYSSAFNSLVLPRLNMKLCTSGHVHQFPSVQLDPRLPDGQTTGSVDQQCHATSYTQTRNIGVCQGCVLSPMQFSLFTHSCMDTNSSNTVIELLMTLPSFPHHRWRKVHLQSRGEGSDIVVSGQKPPAQPRQD